MTTDTTNTDLDTMIANATTDVCGFPPLATVGQLADRLFCYECRLMDHPVMLDHVDACGATTLQGSYTENGEDRHASVVVTEDMHWCDAVNALVEACGLPSEWREWSANPIVQAVAKVSWDLV